MFGEKRRKNEKRHDEKRNSDQIDHCVKSFLYFLYFTPPPAFPSCSGGVSRAAPPPLFFAHLLLAHTTHLLATPHGCVLSLYA